ncbi:MAG: ligand-binding sensor domain-containing protein [Lentimonas sp.]|jgi:ligand-binding sensor domain-containing protein
MQDSQGRMWFGTNQGVLGLEAWSLFEDNQGDIWFPKLGHGVYRVCSTKQLNH